jgi:type IX secretion system PorP/SprF family membrane protein
MLFALVFTASDLNAQDVFFSQYFNNPISINPASTGDHDRYWKFMNNYRSEWKSSIDPFISALVGYDQQVYLFEERFSAGVFYLYDRSGSLFLAKNKMYISGAYHLEMNQFIYNAGIQLGIVSEKFDYQNVTFPDQFDMTLGAFNPDLPTSESSLYESIFYPDINIGISAKRRVGRIIPNAGFSIQHINRPNVSFHESENTRLNTQKNFHLGGMFYITKKMHLHPDAIFVNHVKSNILFFGTKAAIDVPRNLYELKNFYVGSYFKLGTESGSNALIFSTGLIFYNLQIGISYDYNINSINTLNYNRGSVELSIIYLSQTRELQKVTLPCDRF